MFVFYQMNEKNKIEMFFIKKYLSQIFLFNNETYHEKISYTFMSRRLTEK